MTKFLLALATVFSGTFCYAQNVGIGTETPSEKLDIQGNMNVSGQLKLNGDSGKANQVLMKDGANIPYWGDIAAYKNLVMFDCNNVAGAAGANNCTGNWQVPA